MKFAVYNNKGKEDGTINLPKEIFDIPMNADLVHQVATVLSANKRQISAHTKNRGEVSGSGIKPWRQKGTGRARHGSKRSPIWVGGGIAHGPRKDRVLEKDISKKMKRKALLMVLSEKARNNNLIVIDELISDNGKTKDMVKLFNVLPCYNNSMFVAIPKYDEKTILAIRNIKKTKIDEARNLNVLDLLNKKYLILAKDSIKTIEENFVDNKK